MPDVIGGTHGRQFGHGNIFEFNGGSGHDLSGPVMDRAMFDIDNVCKWRDLRVEGVVCKTEQPPHTAYRGFGGPQGMAIGEHVVTTLADKLGVDVGELRRNNFSKEAQETHFGQKARLGGIEGVGGI